MQVAPYFYTFIVQHKVDIALPGVVTRGVHFHIAIIAYKIPLHTTTYLIISLEPIVAPPQKFLSTIDHDPIIIS